MKSQFGYHVIVLDDSRPIESPSFDEVKPSLEQEMRQKNLKTQMDDLKAKAKIDIVGAAPAAAAASAPAATKPAVEASAPAAPASK